MSLAVQLQLSLPRSKIVCLLILSWVSSCREIGSSKIQLLQKQKFPHTTTRKAFSQATVAVALPSTLKQSTVHGILEMLSTDLRLKKFLISWVSAMVAHPLPSIATSLERKSFACLCLALHEMLVTQVTSTKAIKFICFRVQQSLFLDGLDMSPTGIIVLMMVSMICISQVFLVIPASQQARSDKVVTTSVSLKT